jgi:hypothetical protein
MTVLSKLPLGILPCFVISIFQEIYISITTAVFLNCRQNTRVKEGIGTSDSDLQTAPVIPKRNPDSIVDQI